MTAVHGPLGFTDMDPEGMLVEGFNELGTIATIYNYPYYPSHTEKRGYQKDTDWLEYEVSVPRTIPENALKIAALAEERRHVHVLPAKKSKDFLPYAHQIFDVINTTYKDFYGFVPLTREQINWYVKQYFPNVVPDYLKVILDEENKVAGFVIGMPSLSRAFQKARGRLFPFGFIHVLKALKKPTQIDLFLGAIRPDLQGKGADALLITYLAQSCIKNGIVSAESNPELENNLLVQGHWKHFERRQHKRRRCYIKHLG
jgi:ribosomal protein S18 acetylase RimI-like enzyme